MKNQSVVEMMCAYASATGFPPTGSHRHLTDHLLSRLGVRCGTCLGDGILMYGEERESCSECHRFGRRLTEAGVRRLHQIVTARFPELRNPDGRLERAAALWGSKRHRAIDRPIYLGSETLPSGLPTGPDAGAVEVTSITWKHGVESTYLWTRALSGISVLWEHVRDVRDRRRHWTEILAWSSADTSDATRSACRLLLHAWSKDGPAYEWLTTTRLTLSGMREHFRVNATGLLPEQQLNWLLLASARARRLVAAKYYASLCDDE